MQMNCFKFYWLVLFGLSAWIPCCVPFYISFHTPTSFCEPGQDLNSTCVSKIELFTNRLDSVESLVPYDYSSFDFCEPINGSKSPKENLGQVLIGDRIKPSLYNITFKQDVTCKTLCNKTYRSDNAEAMKKLTFLRNGIALNYQNNWIVDNEPVTWCYARVADQTRPFCSSRFPIGCHVSEDGRVRDTCLTSTKFNESGMHYIFNHIDIEVKYHDGKYEDWDGFRLMSVTVKPRSIKHVEQGDCGNPDLPAMAIPVLGLNGTDKLDIIYTYSVTFSPFWQYFPENKWMSRWDYFLQPMPSEIQWFSMLNSLIFVLVFTGIMCAKMHYTLRKNISYGGLDPADDFITLYGWKALHGDVFRPPGMHMLLSAVLGSGCQIFLTIFGTLVFACVGLLCPPNRGAFLTFAVVLFVCLGFLSGYVSARMYKMFGDEFWKCNALLTASLLPGLSFGMFLIFNLVLWSKDSSAAVPSRTLATLLAMWFGILFPLALLGAFLGHKKKSIENPGEINNIPRPVPEQKIWTRAIITFICTVLPFGCIYIQCFFILNSLWTHQVYYQFGVLFVVFLILLVAVAETTVLLCYYSVRSEDYFWWWASFLKGGSVGLYFFLYSIYFFCSKLAITETVSIFLYFGYTLIIVLILFIFTGTVGFFACFFYLRKIYRKISNPEQPVTT